MQQHASSAGVQEHGCTALWNLAAEGGIEAVVKPTPFAQQKSAELKAATNAEAHYIVFEYCHIFTHEQ